MKLKYVLPALTALSLAGVANAQLIMTGIMDGDLSGGNPKFLEFYVTETVADLSIFSVQRSSNGGAFGADIFVFSGSAAAGSFIYVASAASTGAGTSFEEMAGFAPTFVDSDINGNGNDAFRLLASGAVIDIIGTPSEISASSDYDSSFPYQDSYLTRRIGTSASATFVGADWNAPGNATLDTLDLAGHSAVFVAQFGTYSAVPEPSTYAAILGVVALAGVATRRRRA